MFGPPLVDDKSRSVGFNLTGVTGELLLYQWTQLIVDDYGKGLPAYNEWLTDIYELIVKEYVEDVYVDIIETYVIATIKVKRGWIKQTKISE